MAHHVSNSCVRSGRNCGFGVWHPIGGRARAPLLMTLVARELRGRLRADQSPPRFEPCLPRSANEPPAGPGWIHEIKHDGFRILAHRRGHGVRLLTRNGKDFADRFPLAAEAIEALPVRSCVIDGEAMVCDDNGLAVFDLIRGHGANARAILCAFDLLEVNGEDIRREPIEDASADWRGSCGRRTTALRSMRYSPVTARRSTSTPARSAAKASCQSGSARHIALAAPIVGSRSKIRARPRCGGLKRKIGPDARSPLSAALERPKRPQRAGIGLRLFRG
jgi:ATP dependent DNA ligase domain